MIGKQENNHQTELIKIYNQVSKWLSSPQAITDVEKLLYNNFRKGLERIDEEISSLGFESDLWTIRAFYKNGRISELFTFTHFTNWLKTTEEKQFDEILTKFNNLKIPIEVGLTLKQISHLQFFWNIETSEISTTYLGNKVSDELLEIGVVNNLFQFTEKTHKKGMTKILLDYLFFGEKIGLNKVIKKIIQELKVDFEEIQSAVKTRFLKSGNISDVCRFINLRANLDCYTGNKEYSPIIIPFKFKCDKVSQVTYESQLFTQFSLLNAEENNGLPKKSAKQKIKEIVYSKLATEYLEIIQKYSDSDTTISTLLKILQKCTSPEFDTDENYHSEVVAEVRKFVYWDVENYKFLNCLLEIFDFSEIFTEKDILHLLNRFINKPSFFKFLQSNDKLYLSEDSFESFVIKKNFKLLNLFYLTNSQIFDLLKRYSDKIIYQNKTKLHFQIGVFGEPGALNQFLVPRYQKKILKDVELFLEMGKEIFSDNQEPFGSEIIIFSAEPNFSNYRVAKLLLETIRPQKVIFVETDDSDLRAIKLIDMLKKNLSFDVELQTTILNHKKDFDNTNAFNLNQFFQSKSSNQVGEEVSDFEFSKVLEKMKTLLEIKRGG